MGFKNNAYATLWMVDKQKNEIVKFYEGKKYADIQISISRKNANGSYEKDFNGKVRCFSKAYQLLTEYNFKEKDKVQLLDVETTIKFDSDNKRSYVSFTCWDMKLPDNSPVETKKPDVIEPDTNIFDENDGEDDFPF